MGRILRVLALCLVSVVLLVSPSMAVAAFPGANGKFATVTHDFSGVNQDDIHVMNADASGEVALTGGPAYDSEPAWSPDGTRIAFARG